MTVALITVTVALIFITVLAVLAISQLGYYATLKEWERERFELVRQVIAYSNDVLQLPDHARTYRRSEQRESLLLDESGTILPYATLTEMVMIDQEQRMLNNQIRHQLKASLRALTAWEASHPQPKPPTYFGRRFTIGH
jgi:hypothetical protein